jgi:phenylalanyl-tRNA synthetase beta chain
VSGALSRIVNSGTLDTKVAEESKYGYALNIYHGKQQIGQIGKVNDQQARQFGITTDVFFSAIDWDRLIQISNNNVIFKEVPKYPEVRRDLSLVIDKSITFDQVRSLAFTRESRLLKDVRVFDVYEGEKIASDKKAYAIAFTLQDENKTLEDKVIDKTMNKLMHGFESELNAIIRK